MLSINQIAGFLYQNKLLKQPHFFHVDANSQKFQVDPKFFGRALLRIDVTILVSRL